MAIMMVAMVVLWAVEMFRLAGLDYFVGVGFFATRTKDGQRFYGRAKLPNQIWRTQRKPDWVKIELIRLKALMPKASYDKLASDFNRIFAKSRGMTVSKSHVHEKLRYEALAVLEETRRLKRQQPKPARRNAVWAMDMTGKTDVAGRLHMILGVVDHGTRHAVALAALPNKTAWTLVGHLCIAIGRHGKPTAVRTDNEAVFTSRVFTAALRIMGLRHQRTTPGCPWMNGRVERFFGTLKQKLNCWAVGNGAQLAVALQHFHTWYSEIRPHSALGGATPMEAWLNLNPYAFAPKSLELFEAWDGLLRGIRIRR